MGNCLRHGSSDHHHTEWAGEDWGCVAESKDTNGGIEKLRFLGGQMRELTNNNNNINNSYHHSSSREVKIKISKRELEELVGVHGVPMGQLLSHLIINGHDRPDHHGPHLEHQRSWRPVLQSIPELN